MVTTWKEGKGQAARGIYTMTKETETLQAAAFSNAISHNFTNLERKTYFSCANQGRYG